MADGDWKTRVGIEINFNSEEEEEEESNEISKYTEDLPMSSCSPGSSIEGRHFFADDILNRYADYGSTPPRTRISRRLRERKQRSDGQDGGASVKATPKVIHAKATRRNTLDNIYFSQLLERSEPSPEPVRTSSVKSSKRSMKLLRGSERDLKLDIPGVGRQTVIGSELNDDRAESMPVLSQPIQPAIKVETCNRFMSLTSKLVACRAFKQLRSQDNGAILSEQVDSSRVDFYNTFALLIRMGSDKNPRRTLSREEHLWQNELKDLIWLELQAWHANRTLTEQDAYLCQAREGIETLLKEIINYRFKKQNVISAATPELDNLCCSANIAINNLDMSHVAFLHCSGCLSMYCHDCNDAQELALKEIEALLLRLETMEALYPSSKAFAVQHPLYKCTTFISRVKAMCLWFNITKALRLKLKILGKLLMLSMFSDKTYRWPGAGDDDSGIGSAVGTDTSTSEDITELINLSRSSSVEDKRNTNKRMVQFDIDSSSPSDSNNSNASNLTTSSHDSEINDRLREIYTSKMSATNSHKPSPAKNPYRKYIEEVLKTRGLRKALSFLESLHTRVLLKSMLTMENPSEQGLPFTDYLDAEECEEMRHYGFWSDETQSLGLPSYRSAFLFLSRIPLDVIHEFLRMRLEQKPNQPSVLSIRQLMRELKEGLNISVTHRSRYLNLVRTVLWDSDVSVLDEFERSVEEYDASVKSVLEVYLDYLEQWIEMVQQESFRKHLLEEEWLFVQDTCPHIIGGEALAGHRFCSMASRMLAAVGEYLTTSVDQLRNSMDNCEAEYLDEETTSPKKRCLLSVCRDLQTLMNVARVRSLKALAFAKTLRKDLEEDTSCEDIVDSMKKLKMEALHLCHTISKAICNVEEMLKCEEWYEMEEVNRSALLSRCREILHQGYKLGFEYHKEVFRLLTGDFREKLSRCLIAFAKLWMNFVTYRCERGRGLRPRWANHGLDFLMFICEPLHTNYLTDAEFEELKTGMDRCISHVVGEPPPTPDPPLLPPSPRPSIDNSRSPLPLRAFKTTRLGHRRTPSGNLVVATPEEILPSPLPILTRHERVLNAVSNLDGDLDKRLRSNELIGSVTDIEYEDKIHVRLRSVTFGWQRGIKIGQGSYGKVYTAVNNQTGDLMAMKEIQLQPNDHRTIRRVAEELRIFEGIKHEHLVRYFGVEIHREEMLIFMEFCAEGTLESLVASTEGGLPEALIRRYTRQLLQAVATLHRHGVVHRDVKSANIFLTDEGNCLKLGDFGSAVKIKAHTTLPGELQGFVGTQAYMAPEVFMKSTSEGHGRGVDIWSLGCVVVEMASGERPWAEFDSNYQIMFKVGMGETPTIPDTLSAEGQDFLTLCLVHDPKERSNALVLLQHPFSKVDNDEENHSLSLPL